MNGCPVGILASGCLAVDDMRRARRLASQPSSKPVSTQVPSPRSVNSSYESMLGNMSPDRGGNREGSLYLRPMRNTGHIKN